VRGLIGALLAALVLAAPVAARNDGAVRVPISGLSGSIQNPCFGPDSQRLVFTLWPRRYNDGPASVHVADMSSGNVLAKLSPGDFTSVNEPGSCWNAATDRIVFSVEQDAPDWPFSVRPDGTDLRRLVSIPGQIAIEPSFSPNGQQIVFEVSEYDAEGRPSIWLANVDGTGLRRLTRGKDDRQPNWSPTGDQIVFQRRQRRDIWDLWTIRPDGTGLTNVSRTRRISETDVSWAPDGQRLVYSTDRYGNQVASIEVMELNDRSTKRVTKSRRWYDGAPSWSPDEATIAFEARRGDPDGSAGTRIYRIAAPD
jgi:TolB protein